MTVNEKNSASGLGRRWKNRSGDEKAAVRWPEGEIAESGQAGEQPVETEEKRKNPQELLCMA